MDCAKGKDTLRT